MLSASLFQGWTTVMVFYIDDIQNVTNPAASSKLGNMVDDVFWQKWWLIHKVVVFYIYSTVKWRWDLKCSLAKVSGNLTIKSSAHGSSTNPELLTVWPHMWKWRGITKGTTRWGIVWSINFVYARRNGDLIVVSWNRVQRRILVSDASVLLIDGAFACTRLFIFIWYSCM